jgi:hypothetical protein
MTGKYDYLERIFGIGSTFEKLSRAASLNPMSAQLDALRSMTEAYSVRPRFLDDLERMTSKIALPPTSVDFLKSHRVAFEQAKVYDLARSVVAIDRVADQLGFDRLWQSSFLAGIESTSAMLAKTWTRPTGILGMLEDVNKIAASVSWVHDNALNAAALIAHETLVEPIPHEHLDDIELPPPPRLRITVKVTCELCGTDVPVVHQHLHWHGPTEGVFDMGIIPTCSECRERLAHDPDYAASALDRLKTPKLCIIRGDGAGDGTPVGELRLVPREGDATDE